MNTDTLCPIGEIEQLELELRRIRRAADSNLTSWIQFVLNLCERHRWSYSSVMSNEMMVQWQNMLWLRNGKRF
jgi:hypothetical protein